MSPPSPDNPPGAVAPAARLVGITKRYGPVTANRDVDLTVLPGTVHAVVGENGAGKSTLMNVLAGMVRPDAGEVWIRGRRIAYNTPTIAIRSGVGMVHQHFMLVDSLTVAENVVLGREPLRRGLVDGDEACRVTERLGRQNGLPVDPRARVGSLSVGERQRVEILKLLYRGADLLILDEPTAVLTPGEAGGLFAMLRAFAAGGSAIVLITHKLDEVMAVSDRVTVLRHGTNAGDLATADTSPRELARRMVGRLPEILARGPGTFPTPAAGTGTPPVLEVQNLVVQGESVRALDRVSLVVRPGEILGVAGVQGNGQSELMEAVAGLRRVASGTILLDGCDITRRRTGLRQGAGIAHIPEDRNDRGLVGDLSVAENLVLGRHRRFLSGFGGWKGLDRSRIAKYARDAVERFDIRPSAIDAPVRGMSGGNAQKVVAAREIGAGPRLLLAGQPTRGVDVGAIETIHRQILATRDRGAGVLLVSSDLSEILALSDRIVVFFGGRIVGEVDAAAATADRLGEWMAGLQEEVESR